MPFRLPPAPVRAAAFVLGVLYFLLILVFAIRDPWFVWLGIVVLVLLPVMAGLNVPLARRARRWCTDESAEFVSLVSKVEIRESGKNEEYGQGWVALRAGDLQFVASRGDVIRRLPRSPQGEVTRTILDFVGVRTVTYVDGNDDKSSFRLSLLPSTGIFLREANRTEVDRVISAIESAS